ncbi:hypothetical protein Cflav_PD5439 [Pedosphaera parvula Ellin514]|uniref:Uncharacterized protein n=1 Tax=Pedosphaera parvula (strain Ellin514) TaxID=320771 RepID=B9XBB9_PEDPL|nr:hypothetical protein Cflav_PD5439 [Pedosphaera parvula Ellin514]
MAAGLRPNRLCFPPALHGPIHLDLAVCLPETTQELSTVRDLLSLFSLPGKPRLHNIHP